MTETPYEFNLPAGVPFPPIPSDRAVTLERVALGKQLFYDKRLSRNETISCGSCHLQSEGFADHHPISIGIDNRIGFRNSPTLINVAYHPYFFREGGNNSLESQVFGPIEDHREMDFSTIGIIERLKDDENIQTLSHQAFGKSLDNFVIVRALSAFERTLISANSKYDRFKYWGENEALTISEQRGMSLFFSTRLNCGSCHGGFDFSEYAIVNNGAFASFDDHGLARITADSSDIGKFKVPTLRNIELTAPYMHNGTYNSLEEVIERYNQGGFGHPNQSSLIQSLQLSEQEKSDLIAFLKSLTDWDFINNSEFSE